MVGSDPAGCLVKLEKKKKTKKEKNSLLPFLFSLVVWRCLLSGGRRQRVAGCLAKLHRGRNVAGCLVKL